MTRLAIPNLLAFLLVACTTLWISGSSLSLSATFDEPVYLKCGLDCWANHTHKPLMRLGTMPLPVDLETLPLNLWYWWHQTTPDFNNDFGWMLTVARTTALLFWWNLLLQCWRLGTLIAGPWCGLSVLATVALEPNLMGHAALATTDIAVTGCMIATLVEFMRYQQSPSRLLWWKVALWWALSLFAKASALVFVPILILSAEAPALASLCRQHGNSPALRHELWTKLKSWMALGFTALAVVFLLVGTDFQRERTFVEWANSLKPGPLQTTLAWLADHLRIFTNAGEGLAQQIKHNMRGHPSYLLGVGHPKAVWYHFPVLLLIKLPTWFWLLLPFTLWRQWKSPWVPGLVACGLLLAFSVNCRVQIGLRLVFPLVLMLMVVTGVSLATWWRDAAKPRRGPLAATLLLLLWGSLTMARQFPDGLRYINDFSANNAQPQSLVSDSNYDWGQGLFDLASNLRPDLKPDPAQPIWVVYWGGDPRVDLPPFRRLTPAAQGITNADSLKLWLPGKTVAVSATILHGPPLPPEYELIRQHFQNQKPIQLTRCYAVYRLQPASPN